MDDNDEDAVMSDDMELCLSESESMEEDASDDSSIIRMMTAWLQAHIRL